MRKLLNRLDRLLFILLFLFLVAIAGSSGMANIQTDAIDYYAILQRLAGDAVPVVPHLPFVEQRSPGYPLLSLPAYYTLQIASPWITPQTVHLPPPGPPPAEPRASEQALLPPQPLLLREIFFKNYDLAPMGGWFRWDIIAAMLFTSYAFFFAGLIVCGKTLALSYSNPTGWSLAPLIAFSSMVFMHNLVNTPAYATLAAFGASSLFTYFWMGAWQTQSTRAQWAAGLFGGLLVLVRIETVLVIATLLGALALWRQGRFLRNFILGGLIPLTLLLAYNTLQFGNPLHTGILKGDINILAFNAAYIFQVLAGPRSGIVFWSALTSLGLVGLLAAPSRPLKALGAASLVLVGLIALRVPVMYFCVGQGVYPISGILITCPPDTASLLTLIRFDANRYIIPLVPFAVLGLRDLLEKIAQSPPAAALMRKFPSRP